MIVALVGSTILLLGVVMIITPGPALVFIPLGLATLGLEFAWARVWLRKIRERISAESQKGHGLRAEQHRQRHQDI
jgi:tellurite resistance protein TerC